MRELLIVLAILVTVIALTTAGAFWVVRHACHQYSDQTGYETEWRWASGCYVDTDAGWIHEDQLRQFRDSE